MKPFQSILLLVALLCMGAANSHVFGHPKQDSEFIAKLATPTGFLDSVNETGASGWACDPANPSNPLRVFFLLDNVIFAGQTVANVPREQAVADQCGGVNTHGFSFEFPAPIRRILSSGRSHTIAAFAVPFPTGKAVQLQNSPQTVGGKSPSPSPSPSSGASSPSPSRTPSSSPSPGASPSSSPSASVTPSRTPSITPSVSASPSHSPSSSPGSSIPIGFLDSANTTAASGWACDPLRPNTTLVVNILVDGILVSSVLAASTRENAVGDACGGNPNHGFVVEFPIVVTAILANGQPHNVSAFAVPATTGSPVQLQNSPITVQVSIPLAGGFLDSANTSTATGWACNAAFPNTSLTVYVLVDNLYFGGAVVANVPRELAVGGVCGGNVNHGFVVHFPPNIVAILSNGVPHNVSAFLIPSPSGAPVELTNSPLTVQSPGFLKDEYLDELLKSLTKQLEYID